MKNAMTIHRRDFLKSSILSAAALPLAPQSASAGKAADQPYTCRFYPFTDHPNADTCWSLSVGPDGRIYASACAEGSPGGTVKLMRYNEHADKLDCLFDLADKVDDPGDSGRATQCKIHYSFAPSMSDGLMYMATHLSGPPIDLPTYSPWYSWHDPKRCFRGAALVAYDTRKEAIVWWDTLIPKEGCRCLAFDEDRGMLYALGYPRDHFITYDVKTRRRRDIGRIGSINGQAIFLDKKHRAYTTSDYGHLVRYTPEKDRLEWSPEPLPHDRRNQTGWHSVFYDVVASPDRECVYASTWIPQTRLMRIWPNEAEWPRVEDLGPVTQERDLSFPQSMFVDHCGGLTFAADGKLYYVASRWRDARYNPLPPDHEEREGMVCRLDPGTLKREEVTLLKHPVGTAQYVSRGAVDHHGDLFFGYINHRGKPAGIFKVTMPADRKKENAHLPIRVWG
ncbi:MAG: hypothetical protein EHM23_12765 [Acidobacteria bacterium]|nr:MAG: hypothetical protein EHM23_12765 [Acidobacteriota bacterium]